MLRFSSNVTRRSLGVVCTAKKYYRVSDTTAAKSSNINCVHGSVPTYFSSGTNTLSKPQLERENNTPVYSFAQQPTQQQQHIPQYASYHMNSMQTPPVSLSTTPRVISTSLGALPPPQLFLPPPPTRFFYVVPEGQQWVIERLGAFNRILRPGFHFVLPFIDVVRYVIVTKELTLRFSPLTIVTKDNFFLDVEGSITFRVSDAKKAAYRGSTSMLTLAEVAQGVLRTDIYSSTLSEVLRLTRSGTAFGLKKNNETEIADTLPKKTILETNTESSTNNVNASNNNAKKENVIESTVGADHEAVYMSLLGLTTMDIVNREAFNYGLECCRVDITHISLSSHARAAYDYNFYVSTCAEQQRMATDVARAHQLHINEQSHATQQCSLEFEMKQLQERAKGEAVVQALWTESTAKSIETLAIVIEKHKWSATEAIKCLVSLSNNNNSYNNANNSVNKQNIEYKEP